MYIMFFLEKKVIALRREQSGSALSCKTYNPQQKSWHTLQYLAIAGNLSVRPFPPSSMLFMVMKVSLLLYNIVGGGGKGGRG